MTQRIIAAVLAVFFLGLVIVMASVTYFVRDPLPIVSANLPVQFEHPQNGAMITAQLTVAGDNRFEVTVESDDSAAPSAPEIGLSRPGSSAAPLLPEVSEIAPGRWQASGQFPVPGRWQLTLRHGRVIQDFDFIVR